MRTSHTVTLHRAIRNNVKEKKKTSTTSQKRGGNSALNISTPDGDIGMKLCRHIENILKVL